MADNNQSVINQAVDKSIDITAITAAENIVVTADSIKQAARNVLKAAELLHSKEQAEKNLAQLMESTQNDDVVLDIAIEIQKSDIAKEQDYKELMKYVFVLQNEVNLYLGQRMEMVYVYRGSGGNIELWRIENSVEDLSTGKAAKSKGGEIRGRYQLSRKRLRAFAEQGMAARITNNGYDDSGLKATYQEILQRKSISKGVLKGDSSFIILWNTGSGWEGVKVSSEGVLAEAYTGFFLNSIVFDPGGTEKDVGIFMTSEPYGATSVDNTPGFLEGDTTVQGSPVQFGVKTRGASALGYIQIIELAKEIYEACMSETPDLQSTLTSIKDRLHSQGKAHLASKLTGQIEEEFKKLIDGMEVAQKGPFRVINS